MAFIFGRIGCEIHSCTFDKALSGFQKLIVLFKKFVLEFLIYKPLEIYVIIDILEIYFYKTVPFGSELAVTGPARTDRSSDAPEEPDDSDEERRRLGVSGTTKFGSRSGCYKQVMLLLISEKFEIPQQQFP